MFDVGFWELIVIGIVSLIVFGPERFPRVAREAALWIQRTQRAVSSVKSEINRELQLQELRESLRQERALLQHQMEKVADSGSNPSTILPLSSEEPKSTVSKHESE